MGMDEREYQTNLSVVLKGYGTKEQQVHQAQRVKRILEVQLQTTSPDLEVFMLQDDKWIPIERRTFRSVE